MKRLKTALISFMTTTLSLLLVFMTVFEIVITKNNYEEAERIVKRNVAYTAAAEARDDAKGGYAYIGHGSKQTINGGIINGYGNIYGGAFYVANGGTLIINNTTITNCTARYGGAIYIEDGGTVQIHGGTITNNGALYAPAIYVEDGGILELDGTTVIEDNIVDDYFPIFDISNISEDTIVVGDKSSNCRLHYIEFGTYPRTYVTEDSCGVSQETLTTWLTNNDPIIVQSYVVGNKSNISKRTWNAYKYTDGNVYVYGVSKAGGSTYTDGNAVITTGNNVWFKVEPIKWVVLNYDAVMAGLSKSIDVISYEALAGNIEYYYNNSDQNCNEWYKSEMREWLNEQFLNSAFTLKESRTIKRKKILNNATGKSYGKGVTTFDKLYLLSSYEMNYTVPINGDESYRYCNPTDFAVSNGTSYSLNQWYQTVIRPESCSYWLRSSSNNTRSADFIQGGRINSTYVNTAYFGIRPSLSLRYY